MATLTQNQMDEIDDVQTALAAAKVALNAVASACDTLRTDLVGTNTVASLKAANAAGRLAGCALKLRGELIEKHFAESDALLVYDTTNGPGIVVNGPGGR